MFKAKIERKPDGVFTLRIKYSSFNTLMGRIDEEKEFRYFTEEALQRAFVSNSHTFLMFTFENYMIRLKALCGYIFPPSSDVGGSPQQKELFSVAYWKLLDLQKKLFQYGISTVGQVELICQYARIIKNSVPQDQRVNKDELDAIVQDILKVAVMLWRLLSPAWREQKKAYQNFCG